jgi:hypothetical protein
MLKMNPCPRNKKILAAITFLLSLSLSYPALAHYESQKLLGSDTVADDRFGVSVAIDGNTAVIGAYQNDSNGADSGAVYVFQLSGSTWVQQQKLIASDGYPGDKFGRSVAVSGNTIVVGSYLDSNTGSAYVFTRSGSVWTQQQKLTASDAATGDKFGGSVSINNDTIVVGAYGDDSSTGAAYVFVRNGLVWSQQQKLTASGAAPNDKFGYSVSISNDTVVVGAYYDDNVAGSAYVFARNGLDWSQDAVLRAADSNDNDMFGYSVAIDDNWAVVGAPYSDYSGVITDSGSAYLFQRSGSAWSQRQKIIDPNQPGSGEKFGFSVAIHSDRIAIGCMSDLVADQNAGAVYSYSLDGPNWIYQDRLLASDHNEGDNFGCSVAVSADQLIAGAPFHNGNGPASGSVYTFAGLPGDIDSDGGVNFNDLAYLAAAWKTSLGQPAYNPACDISNPPDFVIDLSDLEALCNAWLTGK